MDTYFSCAKFAAALRAKLGGPLGPPVHEAALDLVALFLLGAGNDYMSPVGVLVARWRAVV
jgi:hypothetical protein